jgi:hyperosmotically inducible protein
MEGATMRKNLSRHCGLPALLMYTLTIIFIAAIGATAGSARQDAKTQRGESPARQNLLKEVRHQLQLLPYYSVFDYLSYRIDGDTVKSDAASAVREIEGITGVVNNIEVLPVSPTDDELRRALYRALYNDTALARYAYTAVPAVHIIVKNGNVTLEGIVDSESDKNLANSRANAVPNVFSMKNNLTVATKTS